MSILKLNKVTKTYYPGGTPFYALKGVCLDIQPGEFISIIGPSGSGKSTLMHIIGLLDQPTTGEVFFDNENVSQHSEVKLASIRNRGIGFVFQQFNLLPKTSSLDNVILPLLYSNVPANQRRLFGLEVLDKVNLSDKIDNKPSQLSGGQQQRVAIARALINKPKVILADEPTGNLDSQSGKEVMEIFKNLHHREGRTIVIVTHDINIAKQAKRIVKIMDGKIVSNKKE